MAAVGKLGHGTGGTMKKLLLIILSVVVVSSAFAGEIDGKGGISGWKFAGKNNVRFIFGTAFNKSYLTV